MQLPYPNNLLAKRRLLAWYHVSDYGIEPLRKPVLVGMGGVEPPAFRLSDGRSYQAELHTHYWSGAGDSNPFMSRSQRGLHQSKLAPSNSSGGAVVLLPRTSPSTRIRVWQGAEESNHAAGLWRPC